MHNNKRVREERANTILFTWFGNPHLLPRLQANQTRRFCFKFVTINFQGVNRPFQLRDYLIISSPKCSSQLYTHKFDEKNEEYSKQLSLRVDLQIIPQ